MDITEVLQFVDRLVEKQTGEHLNNLQKEIIQGLWQGKTYQEISESGANGYNENYIGDTSRQLFKVLSEQLDEDIKKSNFCWTIERAINSPHFVALVNRNITYCPYHDRVATDDTISHPEHPKSAIKYHDLILAPKIRKFCDRTTEISTLSHWLCDQNIPLISVVGRAGIGKTSLVKRWIDLNLE